MDNNKDFTIRDLLSELKRKTKLSNVLKREGNIYLPPKQDSTQKLLRSILLGTKLYVN